MEIAFYIAMSFIVGAGGVVLLFYWVSLKVKDAEIRYQERRAEYNFQNNDPVKENIPDFTAGDGDQYKVEENFLIKVLKDNPNNGKVGYFRYHKNETFYASAYKDGYLVSAGDSNVYFDKNEVEIIEEPKVTRPKPEISVITL